MDALSINEAVKLFERNRVPDWMYVVKGLGGGETEGVDYMDGQWTVYYSERGNRNTQEKFASEAAAVERWIARVSEYLELAEHRSIQR